MLRCPVCDTPMREIEKFNVIIDICPSCKGVWLDRGELDKIIQYAQYEGPINPTKTENPPRNPGSTSTNPDYMDPYYHKKYEPPYKEEKHYHYEKYYKKKHHKNRFSEFLEDLFDFG